MNFGHVLRTLRISAGVSLRELARTIDVSPTYLSLVENGKQSPPNAVRIAQIEEALKVSPRYLLSITQGPASDVTLFAQQVPEVMDFLNVAKQNSMGSADFMELTAFLNTYGWKTLKQTLKEKSARKRAEPSPDPRDRAAAGPYISQYLSEKLIFDLRGIREKALFLEKAVTRIASQCEGLEPDVLLRGLIERENIASTGIGSGVAVPHAYISGLDRMIVALLRIPDGLDYDAIDGEPVHMALLLAGPRSSENLHLKLLARIAKLLSNRRFRESVLAAPTPRKIISFFRSAERGLP